MKYSSSIPSLAALLALAGSLSAQTTWTGSGTDNSWSTVDNWSAGVPVTTGTAVFSNFDKTTSAAPNSVVSSSGTIRSLFFTNTGTTATDWQNVEIASGQTLSINNTTSGNNALLVGSGTATASQVKIAGSGTLAINGGTASNILLTGTQGNGGNAFSTVTFDLSELAGFTATVNNLSVGGSLAGLVTMNLGSGHSVTANTVTVGSSVRATGAGAGQNSVLNLGSNNTLNANSIVVGAVQVRSGGTLKFASPGGSVDIRARDGVSRANMTIGQGGDGSQTITNTVDFTGGTVDALLGNLLVGGSGAGNGNVTGNFSMDQGTVDATSVVVASRTGGNSGAAIGNLNLAGGSFQAGSMTIASQAGTATNTATGSLNVAGSADVQVGTSGSNADIVMGVVTGLVNLTANANVTVTGGTLTVFGNIAEGTNAGIGGINSTVTLNGGVLDLTGHAITVDTFNAESGTLANLAEFNGGADLVKSTAGSLTLDGDNTYSGSTLVNAGTLVLADDATMTFYIGASGVNNGIGGTGTISLEGDFVFDLSSAAAEGSWLIVDVGSLGGSFAGSFTVQGFSETSAGVWESGNYTFTEATGLLTAVPEPSAVLLTGLGLAGILWRRRRVS